MVVSRRLYKRRVNTDLLVIRCARLRVDGLLVRGVRLVLPDLVELELRDLLFLLALLDLDVYVNQALYWGYASGHPCQGVAAEVTYAHNHVLDDRRCDDNGAAALWHLRHVADDFCALAVLGESDDSGDLRLEEFRLLVRLDADKDCIKPVRDNPQAG